MENAAPRLPVRRRGALPEKIQRYWRPCLLPDCPAREKERQLWSLFVLMHEKEAGCDVPPLLRKITVFSSWDRRPGVRDRYRSSGRHGGPAGVCGTAGRPPAEAGSDDDASGALPAGPAKPAVLVVLP